MGKLLIEFQCTELLFCSVRSEMTVIKMLWCLRERQMRISLHTLSVLSRQRIHSWLWLTYCCMTNSAVQRKHHAAPWLTGALGLFLFVQRPSSDGTPFFIHGLFQSTKDLFNVIVCGLHCTTVGAVIKTRHPFCCRVKTSTFRCLKNVFNFVFA